MVECRTGVYPVDMIISPELARGCIFLLNADIYDKILLLIIVCSSVYNLLFTLSMNKSPSLFKLLGLSFFIPSAICISAFVLSASTTAGNIISLSEFCLSFCILLLLIQPYNSRNNKFIAAAIIITSLIFSVFLIRSENFIFYKLSVAARTMLTVISISAALVYIKGKNKDQRLVAPLAVWLAGVLTGLVKNQEQVIGITLLLKTCAYSAFIYYFYSITYNSYMSKINESQDLVKAMEHSLYKEVKKRVFEIEKSNERLLEISKTDMLTRAFNKATILNIIERLISNKKIEVFSLIMFDIDNFKIINDSLGHVTGDICLKTLANIASGNIREVDYLGRYGGDEFIIVLPTLGESEAKFVAERFKNKVNETTDPRLTVSMGISTYPKDGQTVNELISVADKGLYRSKSKGKNTISHASI
jgi:diguanylate cyclase (GGDEF)-like protein